MIRTSFVRILCSRLIGGVGSLAILCLLLATPKSEADVFTFADFTQQTPSSQNFSYTNPGSGGGSATFNTVSGGDPIWLSVTNTSIVPPGFPTLQKATLFLTSSTAVPAVLNPSDNSLQEIFPPPATNTMSIVLTNPFNGKTNFLSASFTATQTGLTGTVGSDSGGFSGSDAAVPPDIVSYSSDFINFAGSTEHSVALSFSSITSAGGGLQQDPTNSFFESFTASGTGTFDTNFGPSTVPAPAGLIQAGIGVVGSIGMARRRWLRIGP